MKQLCAGLLLGSALLLVGCGGPTAYVPAAGASSYGYKDLKLQDNRYRVSFSGNQSTERETVQNYLLYRAAELTLATGNRYFVQVNGNTDKSTTYIGNGGIGFNSFFYPSGFGFGLSTALPSSEYTAYAVIDVSKNKPARGGYDAQQVIKNLGPLVQKAQTEA